MALMRFSHGDDGIGMRSGGEPIEQLCPDRPAPRPTVSGIDWTFAPGDNQHHPRAHRACLIKSAGYSIIGAVERVTVQVECIVRRDLSVLEPAIPM